MGERKMSELYLPAFHDFYRESRKMKKLFYVLKGGRNSSKSTHIAIDLVKDMCKYPIDALCVRKVGNTLQDSVYEQIKWAIDFLELGHLFHCNISPLRITYLPRGNKIIFRGADKPERIKSIKSSKFPIARLWCEEIAEFKTEDDIKTIVNSIIRAELPEGIAYKVYYSYNPPKRKQSWVNKKFESVMIPDNTYVHHSTYKDNPHVSKAFLEEAETVRTSGAINKDTGNSLKYDWDYGGKPIGAGVVPFSNLVFRRIGGPEDPDVIAGLAPDEISNFDNIRQGLDWGYGTDPLAFVRMHYDKTRRRLYIFDEYYAVKTSNREIAEWIKKKKYDDFEIVADSAEPKSIDDLRELGIKRIRGAKKPAGSVEHGEKWLDDLEEIVIDPKRTPNVAKEFEDIDYQVDAQGNIRNKLEDKDNHTIDSVRYGCEDEMRSNNKLRGANGFM
jgi:PBSX family phage terminase large subunit